MVEKLKLDLKKEDYEDFFKFLLNTNFKENFKTWIDDENGRVNRKFLFKSENQWKKVIPINYHKKLESLIKKIKRYETPFPKEKINFLNRIQVIESNFTINSKNNDKGRHLFHLHCDRINTYKIYVFFSDIDLKDGPIYFARIDKCKDQVNTKLKEIEVKKKQLADEWRKMDSRIFCKYEEPFMGKFGDVLIFDGREPHRASPLTKKGYRAVVIFEFFTDENWNLYSKAVLKQ